MVILTAGSSAYAQFITVLVVFVLVLAVTAITTKWVAGYQKQQARGSNIEIMETVRVGNLKYIQLVRVGETYVALYVCKDTATVLCQVPEEELVFHTGDGASGFQAILKKAVQTKAPEEKCDDDSQINK